MLDEIISYHRYSIELLLLVMGINLLLPFVLRANLERMVFWSRIGYFSFWAFWSTSVFTGLILFMFTGRKLTPIVIGMIAIVVLLGFLDGYRSIKSRKIWISGTDAVSFSGIIVLLEIIATTTIFTIAVST